MFEENFGPTNTDKAKYFLLLAYRFCLFLVKMEKINEGNDLYKEKTGSLTM